MEACKKLHKSGELMEHNLLPMDITQDMHLDNDFTPNFDPEEQFIVNIEGRDVRLGTKNHKRLFQKKVNFFIAKIKYLAKNLLEVKI